MSYGIINISYIKPIPEEHTVSTEIVCDESGTTELTPFSVSVVFSEKVFNFVIGDVVVTNGTKSEFTNTNGRVYTMDITPTVPGLVKVNVAGNVAHTREGYINTTATEFSVEFVDGN
jgi:hypothetical protein